MTKAEFMSYLDNRLAVLNANEREDIKQEYSQHIDIKVENGMTETEAVAALGDISAMVDEILMAYNIDPDYRKGKGSVDIERIKEGIREAGEKVTNYVSKRDPFDIIKNIIMGAFLIIMIMIVFGIGYAIADAVADIIYDIMPSMLGFDHIAAAVIKITFIIVFILAVCAFIIGIIGKKETNKEIKKEGVVKMENTIDNKAAYTQSAEKTNTKSSSDKIWDAAVLMFKLFIIFALLPAVFTVVGSLIAQGVLMVLMFLGYPMIGVNLVCLGFNICMITFLAVVIKLLFGKKE